MQMTGRSYTSSADQRYKFTGKERDASTGLDYFGKRYYDSFRGQWLEVDPLADKYPGWSSYNYVENNPIRHTDLHGDSVKYQGTKNQINMMQSWVSKLKSTSGRYVVNRLEQMPQIVRLKVGNSHNLLEHGNTNNSFIINKDKSGNIKYIYYNGSMISIDKLLNKNSEIETLAHELRHAYQALTDPLGTYKQGKEELQYIRAKDYLRYRSLPIEHDAFWFEGIIQRELSSKIKN